MTTANFIIHLRSSRICKNSVQFRVIRILANSATAFAALLVAMSCALAQDKATREYDNRLTPIKDPKPLLADYPEFVQPVVELKRFEAPMLVDDENGDLNVRAWRFSYNARGIIEMPNRLVAKRTAVIMVHPWGIDDSQGWRTPEPAGVSDMCTPEKNRLSARHTEQVIEPLLKRLRDHVGLIVYSLPRHEQPVHAKLYRSIRKTPTAVEREEGRRELNRILHNFPYRGEPLPAKLKLSRGSTVKDYFQQFPGLDAGPKYEGAGFWDLPIPVIDVISVAPTDVVIYDGEGYPSLRDFLKKQGIEHVLLTGYATDMCFCKTTAGYENLSKDFNVFLVGDATLATFPANNTPKYATNAHISFAALNQLITQTSWIQLEKDTKVTTVK
jgi:isochorismatase family protein